jgi:hypothetical protein
MQRAVRQRLNIDAPLEERGFLYEGRCDIHRDERLTFLKSTVSSPHLWAVMPVPWAHLLVSERTLLKACRRVYHAPWYRPNRHDFDAAGRRLTDKYTETEISRDCLNHDLISDFENAFRAAGFACQTDPIPFGSPYARWTQPVADVAWLRGFLSGYVWFILTKPRIAGDHL